MIRPLYPIKPGRILMTQGAVSALMVSGEHPGEFLIRHISGDFGDVSAEDAAANDQAVRDGGRIVSAYVLATGIRLWIITEADRSATTFLLPDEY